MIAAALSPAAAREPELLPTDPSMWLNSPPLSAEALAGKGVVLWFFEETCPKCRGKWPAMYQLAKKYEGEPVLFIAVNSGNAPAVVQQYAREVQLAWPIIVDPFRQYESLWKPDWMDAEISLQNIHQCELILPTGQRDLGSWEDLEGSVKKALEGAAWKIDPKTIPAPLLSTWQAVELGNYPAAAGLLKKGLVTKNAEVKEAATRLHTFVNDQLQATIDAAGKARQANDLWQAYRLYSSIGGMFAGYDVPAEVATARKELASDPQVKDQLAAAKLLDGIQRAAALARSEAARKRVASRLQQLIKQYPGTEAAAEAQTLINESADAGM